MQIRNVTFKNAFFTVAMVISKSYKLSPNDGLQELYNIRQMLNVLSMNF